MTQVSAHTGRWVTDRVYSELHCISRQTLANWRQIDRQAGRKEARPGYPIYRYFGAAVRYWLENEGRPEAAGDVDHGRPEAAA